MKLISWTTLHDNNFTTTQEYTVIKKLVTTAIQANDHPRGTGTFKLHPGRKANGVVPIKAGFLEHLIEDDRWQLEERIIPGIGKCDAVFHFDNAIKPFVVEWETGNVSSSHQAINRILKGIIEGYVSGGLLILPTRDMYKHLTDRVGNHEELEPYFNVWQEMKIPKAQPYYLGVIAIEHDELDNTVDLIPKGNDGNALVTKHVRKK